MATPGTTVETREFLAGAPMSGTARWARGATVGSSATGLALAGHLLGGGVTPPVLPLLVLAALAVASSIGLSGRRWSLPPLLGVLLGAQVSFHVVFDGAAPSHRHAVVGHVMTGHTLGWQMVAAHLLATLATALLLRRGEAWCCRLVGVLADPLRATRQLTTPVAVGVAAPSVAVPRAGTFWQSRWLVLSQSRRGPPAVPAA
ncbi:MAG: hypothetical protein ACXV4A_04445 [Actinomycetes bacterium]